MSDTGVYQGRVRLYGMPFHEDGEVLKKVMVTLMGDTAKLSQRSEERQLYMEIDFLDQVKVTEGRGGTVEFTGQSRQLRDEVGSDETEAKWELIPRGCTTCH